MKHNLNVTIIIILVFLITQITGLYLVNKDITTIQNVNGTITIEHQETVIGPRPDTTGMNSFIYLTTAIFIGTLLILLIMKFKKMFLWKTWFFLAIFLSISVALGVLINYKLAFIFALILATLKMIKKHVIIHNLTEILMYSGLAVIIVPIIDLKWTFILLIVISFYDMFAVWKSKHMVKMAQFQAKSKLFAGLMIPYEESKGIKLELPPKPVLNQKKQKIRNAILGGGDVAFPLIFSGVVMENLIIKGISSEIAFLQSTIISFVVTISIFGLFVFAKKNKFYPAMPVVTIGCIIGYLIILII